MTFNIQNLVHAGKALIQGQELRDASGDEIVSGKALMLAELQAAETDGVGLVAVKEAHFDSEGWAYRTINPDTGVRDEVEGDAAPGTIKTAYSEAKKAKKLGLMFNDFNDWESMKKACQGVDELKEIKALEKQLHVDLKKLDNGWKEYAEGALEKLVSEIQKALPKEK
jgi:hypothetical protein